MSITELLRGTGLPCAYSHFRKKTEPPFLVYLQNGQNQFSADDTRHYYRNTYQIEYYFEKKDPAAEAAIEEALLAGGYRFTRSEDIYLDEEDVFVIYYYTN